MSINSFRFLWYCSLLFLTTEVFANETRISDICEQAANTVSLESGVPLTVLRAISLNETGRKKDGVFRPWPWTVNMEGLGKWFENRTEAQAYVDKHFARGARSFDVGCFQINYKWHGQFFDSVEEMFDPLVNARYAARFLNELFDEFGDWSKAAGAYHSRTPKYANKYAARFNRIRANLGEPPGLQPAPIQPKTAVAISRVNTFPLLQRGAPSGGFASLVPLANSGTKRLIDMNAANPLGGS